MRSDLEEAPATAGVSKAPPRIAGMFDAIAGRYDLLNHLLSAGIDRHWRRCAVRALALTGNERVIDLCTGTADLAIAAASARPSARLVIGLDFAAAMLQIGHEKVRRRQLNGSIALIRGDATHIPLAGASADALTIAFGIRNVEDPATACREIHRVLVPGGKLAVLEFAVPTTPGLRRAYLWYFNHVLPRIGRAVSKHDAAYAYLPASVQGFAVPAEFAETLRASGFVDIAVRPLTFGIACLFTAHRAA